MARLAELLCRMSASGASGGVCWCDAYLTLAAAQCCSSVSLTAVDSRRRQKGVGTTSRHADGR